LIRLAVFFWPADGLDPACGGEAEGEDSNLESLAFILYPLAFSLKSSTKQFILTTKNFGLDSLFFFCHIRQNN